MRHCLIAASMFLAALAVLNTALDSSAEDTTKKATVKAPAPTPPKGPGKYRVKFETTKGDFVVEVTRASAPIGADRFHEAVTGGFYNGCGFFRVLPGFMAQFGINGDPAVQRKWRMSYIKDDPVKESNVRGTITFATAGPNTRTAQLFINYGNNSRLDRMGFAPFGKIVTGMEVVDKINSKYRQKPNQALIQSQGNKYLEREFPGLDYIKKVTVLKKKK